MATFPIDSSFNVTPKELTALSAGSPVIQDVNSNIGKIFSGSTTQSFSASTKVKRVTYQVTSSPATIATICGTSSKTILFIMIRFDPSYTPSGDPLTISVNTKTVSTMNLIGDFFIASPCGMADTDMSILGANPLDSHIEILIGTN